MTEQPQICRLREIIVHGTLAHLQGVVEFEQVRTGRGSDDYRDLGEARICDLYGPIREAGDGASVYWLVTQGYHMFLDHQRAKQVGCQVGGPHGYLELGPETMTLDELHHEARRQKSSLSRILRVGEVRAGELPNGRVRIVFNATCAQNTKQFWSWVDSFVGELERQGFQNVGGRGSIVFESPVETVVVQQTEKGDNVMIEKRESGDTFDMSGDFRGAILNIRSVLNNVSQSIGQIPNVDDSAKDELKKLVDQLNEALQKAPQDKAEEAEAVALSAKMLVEQASAEKPNWPMVKITGEGLKAAAQNLATVLPVVLTIATQIVVAVTKLLR